MRKVTLKQNQIEAIEYALTTERLEYYHNPDALIESHIRFKEHFIDVVRTTDIIEKNRIS